MLHSFRPATECWQNRKRRGWWRRPPLQPGVDHLRPGMGPTLPHLLGIQLPHRKTPHWGGQGGLCT
ncbi:hypothetical protein HanXRQr2_Chr13g0607181 [Helianthus annuus]|uniref:Uncharacterized protein n=1 Tax=Helianthus annuus TaxID=4232 RepID=A0A9K3HDL2_HELAN|nr:hypothetical protein HanXRQr2_Chr13g0607181 [Helianthus annuus]KAJ0850832.1 hypothetical protein HanPSC8_Chr13g0585401 [Helianthus annuus]